jgi:ribosomal protein S27AE
MSELAEIRCPNCTEVVEGAEEIRVACGKVGGTCTCPNCGNRFEAPEVDYWRWLGLETAPPIEPQ